MTPRSTSPLHICLRRTVDWGDEPAFRAQLDPAFAPKVNAWNATFPLPYHLFRQELRWIAQANLEKVEGAVLCRWEEVPEGALVAPVDDDDWFAPHLVEVIKAAACVCCCVTCSPLGSRAGSVPPTATWPPVAGFPSSRRGRSGCCRSG